MTLRIATLNIWNRMAPWDERLVAIRTSIPPLAPDILGLQEVVRIDGFDQAALIGEDFGYSIAHGRHPESPHPMGNAILSRWPIERTETFPLPREGTDEFRSLVFAEVDSPLGKLHVYCTHLNWKAYQGHVRQVQMRFVADTIERLSPRDEGFPPILVGDMNAQPDADEIRFLCGLTPLGGTSVYFADAFGLSGDGPGYTFSRENAFAATLREPNRRIDYIFVRGPDEQGRGEPLEAKLCFDRPHEGVFPSDHFGVLADISTEAVRG